MHESHLLPSGKSPLVFSSTSGHRRRGQVPESNHRGSALTSHTGPVTPGPFSVSRSAPAVSCGGWCVCVFSTDASECFCSHQPPPPPPPIAVLVQLLAPLAPLLSLSLHTLAVRRESAAGETRVHSNAGQVTGWKGGCGSV